MAKSIFHTSENQNTYLYDIRSRLSMLVHPDLKIAAEETGEVDSYYRGKYGYLKNCGFFKEGESVKFGEITESMIRDSLIHTPQITFETTDFCNLNCTYCPFGELYEGFDERNHKNIDIDFAKKLLRFVFNNRPESKKQKLLIGFYGGEPLFNGKFILQIVDFVDQLKKEKYIEVEYNITTNALLLHKYMDFFVKNRFRILISLDGNRKNHSYRSVRKDGNNSFDRVIENVDRMQYLYPVYFEKYVRFNAVLHDRNSVKEIQEFVYERYHKVSRIAPLVMVDLNKKNEVVAQKMYRNKLESEIDFQKEESELLPTVHEEFSVFKELIDFLKYYSLNYYVSNITSLLYETEKILPTSTCLPGQKKILLTTHGKLLPCERVNYKYTIGEIREDVVLNIPEITVRYKHYYHHVQKICQHCFLNRFCNNCMLQLKMLDQVDKKDFVCEHFCNDKGLMYKLYRVLSFLEKYPLDFFKIVENHVIL